MILMCLMSDSRHKICPTDCCAHFNERNFAAGIMNQVYNAADRQGAAGELCGAPSCFLVPDKQAAGSWWNVR